MRDNLKSISSIDESEYNISTNNSQDTEMEVKTVTFADKVTDDRSALLVKIEKLSQENIG